MDLELRNKPVKTAFGVWLYVVLKNLGTSSSRSETPGKF
jgi:hypothetical protein